MKYCLLLLTVTLTFFVKAQSLTESQALAFADQLYQVEILSQKGKNKLIEQIQQNNFERTGRRSLQDGSIPVIGKLSVSNLLLFCAQAFGDEFYYRTGLTQQMEMLNAIQKKNKPTSDEDLEKLARALEKKWRESEAFQIEERISAEDTLPAAAQSFAIHPFSIPQAKEYGLIHPNRSALGKTVTRTANDLRKIGLIDEKIHQEVIREIHAQGLFYEMLVVGYAAQRATFYEDFQRNKAEEVTFLQRLKEKRVLSAANYERLMASYQPYELKEKFDLIPYCNHALVFDLSTYPLEPSRYYEQIFKEMKRIIPDFTYSNLTVTITPNPEFDSDLIQQNATISFVMDGRRYSNTFFHNYIRKVPQPDEKPDTLPQVSTEFHKGINKWLADRNSPERLYYANKFEQGYAYNHKTFGLILLTEEQFKAWGTYNSDYFLFEQSHDNSFNSENIYQIIGQYEQIGLFSHLNQSEKAEAIRKVEESEIDGYCSILVHFPRTIVYFDWETGNLENPYQELTQRFGEASRGGFTPTKISDTFQKDWKKKKTKYSFQFKGKTYVAELEMNGDWLDPKFLELIEKSLSENKVDGGFYYCLDNGQAGGYIFLTKAQHQHLQQNQPSLFPNLKGEDGLEGR